ncbi:Ig-like domain-containing protein [Paenibacillus sp. PAMC21692]|uniref:Ig-like domain-containing protein n=1 Tax=Paenibacillus sp. PAMC21692 TaxID=2762320 RepID=UPI00164E3684|nr:Ig-like domain-containing protein [Paenibacillus sp. PAMC21692]QNK57382.1 Ig-like domain-containing protein [Paenibacillus sp. PAMC21692]
MINNAKGKFMVVFMAFVLLGSLFPRFSLSTEVSAENLGHTLFVAPNGDNESGLGTINAPFATLEKARDAIRELKADSGLPDGGITVYLRGGEYRLGKSFELTEEDSGTEDNPIIYKAYNNEEVKIMGGATIDASEFKTVTDENILNRLVESARGKVVKVDLAQQGITEYGELVRYGHSMNYFPEGISQYSAPELFINGESQTLARWPNNDFATVKKVIDGGTTHEIYPPPADDSGPWEGFVIEYDGDRPSRWTEANDIWMYGYWRWDWSDQSLQVDWIDTDKKQIKSVQPSAFGILEGQRYYVYNLLEEIDMPGEYYLDRKSGSLYLYPKGQLEEASVQLSVLEEDLIHISNASHISFEGMYMGTSRKNAFYIEDSSHIIINDMTLAQLGNRAIITKNSKKLQIINNDIFDTGAGGITLSGGDRMTLTPGENVADNNHIYNFSRIVRTYTPAILIEGVGNSASHNLIHGGPHTALVLYGNDHLIEYNEFFNVVTESDDAGAVYAGRNWTERGNVIRYNFFHDIGGLGGRVGVNAIYLDDAMSSAATYGNVFYDLYRAVVIGGGRDHSIENNLIIDGVQSIFIDDRAYSLPDWFKHSMDPDGPLYTSLYAVPFQEEPWSSRYPELASILDDNPGIPAGNSVRKNVMINSGEMQIADIVKEYGVVENNLTLDAGQDPGFVDADNMNFSLKPESIVFDQVEGFEDIPFDNIGLYQNDKRIRMPSTGSFNLSSPIHGSEEVEPTKVEFTWEHSQSASAYRFVLALDHGFEQVVHNETVNNTSIILEDLSEKTTYYWKVEAQGSSRFIDNTWNSEGVFSFKTKEISLVKEPVTGIELDQSKVSLEMGERRQLNANVLPQEASNRKVDWVSSNPAVASVDNTGLVIAHKSGSAVIAAVSDENEQVKAEATVTVKPWPKYATQSLNKALKDKKRWTDSDAVEFHKGNVRIDGEGVFGYEGQKFGSKLLRFKAKLGAFDGGWYGFALRSDRTGDPTWVGGNKGYLLVIKEDQIEFQTWKPGHKMVRIIPNDEFKAGGEYEIEIGVIRSAGGERYILKSGSRVILNELDSDPSNPIAAEGYFNVYNYAGDGNAIELKQVKGK